MHSPDGSSSPDRAIPAPARDARTTDGLPVAPSLAPTLEDAHVGLRPGGVDARVVRLSLLALGLAGLAALVARTLGLLIQFVTNLSFFGRISFGPASPADNKLGWAVVAVPVVGGFIVGLMARYGARAIRGHGIPEAMENVLLNDSRIPPKMTLMKPLSAAVAIGTGGPFGAEGPIIATGGALGSLIGQLLHTTPAERKTLLAAGAAAGMAATFGTPVSAVVLAVELLLFEYRPRSLVPVSLAAMTASALRALSFGSGAVFEMPTLPAPSIQAVALYVLLGAVLGAVSVVVTRAVYGIEDAFEKLPIHWMWWPALGAVAVGVVGVFAPLTLGVGYTNIENLVSGEFTWKAIAMLTGMKFISWSISLGSGTSGGTLAPLLTIGGGLGSLGAVAITALLPAAGVDARMAALIGMAALFAGASRALLASVLFALEATHQMSALLPLLGACSASFLVSALLMRHSIMTEKIARRGVRVVTDYGADLLERTHVGSVASRTLVTLSAAQPLAEVRQWLASDVPQARHQGFPVVDAQGLLLGVVTRRDLQRPDAEATQIGQLVRRPAFVIDEEAPLAEAVEHMVQEDIGRLVVVARGAPRKPVGILTRSDVLGAHRQRVREEMRKEQTIQLPMLRPRPTRPPERETTETETSGHP